MNQNIQILNKTVPLHTNQLVSIVIIIPKVGNLIKLSRHIPQNNRKILEISLQLR